MRTRLSSAKSWGFSICARPGRFIHLSAVLVLVLTCAACADRETADVVEEGETVEEPMDDQMGAAPGMEAENAVTVSITGTEIMMPTTLPPGTTTLTVRNTSDEPCTFTMATQEGQGMGMDTPGQTPDAGAEAGTPAGQPGAAEEEMMQGAQDNVVDAGGTATLTMNLQPGTYEVDCGGMGTGDAAGAEQLEGRSVQVIVSDAGTPGTGANPQGGVNPQDGTTSPQDEANPQDGQDGQGQ